MILGITVVALSGLLSGVGWMVWRRKKTEDATLVCQCSGLVFRVPKSVNFTCGEIKERFGMALVVAASFLGISTSELNEKLNGVLVHVRTDRAWDQNGLRVAGLTYHAERLIIVGCDLMALSHEFIEVVKPDFHRKEN